MIALMKFPTKLLFLLAFFVSSVVSAQQLKVGAVSEQRILRDSAIAKAATARLERDFSPREREIVAAENAFRAAVTQFERDSPTLSESQRVAKQRQLSEQEREIQRRRRDFQEELSVKRNEETLLIYERASRAIRQFAETEKYDLIFQDAAYISPRLDVTDSIIKIMDSMR